MLFRQLFDAASSTYTYLLADRQTREAVLVDSVFEQHARDAALLRELGLKLLYTLDTHCHADHVTGAWRMKVALGSQAALSAAYGAENIDRVLVHGDRVRFGAHALEVRAVPGHTDGCLAFVTEDRAMVFTGDALLVRGTGRTDFQGGDAGRLYRSIHEQLFSLPDACVVYPGHDYEGRTSSTVAEERAFNARIGGGAREADFVGTMRNLGLPHPKQIAVAVPANLRGGRPEDGVLPSVPAWGPVVTTYAGLPEIAPEWVAAHRDAVAILDVRDAPELDAELGHLLGAHRIPLDDLRARVADVPTDLPVVLVCRTGRRSALATQILRKAGREDVANLAGGMVAWRDLGLPS
jgi:glyoxylase-like metal-dependent hydrolase (beta-lactamase superfamily II)/rhodanese-related sulfurtransferase